MKEIVEKYRIAFTYDEQNRKDSAEDLSFRAGNQWDGEDERIRKLNRRPTLVLSHIDQFVRRIVGQTRTNNPSLRVFAADETADHRMTMVYEGAIRDIEQASNAKAARIYAHDCQVTCGIGHYRVYFDWHETMPYVVIRVETILDPLSVIWDPASKEKDRSDAGFCFVNKQVPIATFEAQFPEANAIDFAASRIHSYGFKYNHGVRYHHGQYVRLVEHWEKYDKEHKFILTIDGLQIDVTEMEDDEILQYRPIRKYKRTIQHVRYQLLNGEEILEKIEDYPCRHIPIVPVIGEEIYTDEGVYRQGVVRKMREGQKFYNYLMSIAMEQMGQSVKSPYLVTNAMIAGNEALWRMANVASLPFLPYQPDANAPQAKPERSLPPTQHRDTIAAAQNFMNDISGAAGLYEDALGKETNAKSGVAIQSRQKEGIITTNIFGDHFGYSIRQEGRIILSMIQHLYNEERRIRIISSEEEEEFVTINERKVNPLSGETFVLNDMTYGNYEVRAEAGQSYGAIKADALQSLMELVRINPEMLPILMPEIAKLMEVPNQEALLQAAQQYTNMKMGQMQAQQQAIPQQGMQALPQAV